MRLANFHCCKWTNIENLYRNLVTLVATYLVALNKTDSQTFFSPFLFRTASKLSETVLLNFCFLQRTEDASFEGCKKRKQVAWQSLWLSWQSAGY